MRGKKQHRPNIPNGNRSHGIIHTSHPADLQAALTDDVSIQQKAKVAMHSYIHGRQKL